MSEDKHKIPTLVSVIMSAYNGGRFLKESIDSVLNQTYKNLELVLVNDGSTDSSADIISSYQDKRIVCIDRKENKGLTTSLNEGLQRARGQYIARLDVGDVALPTRIEEQVRFLEQHPEVGIVGTGIELFYKNHTLKTYLYPSDHNTIKNQLFHFVSPLPHSTLMMRRTTLEMLNGYCEHFLRSQDYDLLLRALEVTSLSSLPKVLVRWRFDPLSLSYGSSNQLTYGIAALVRAYYRLKGCRDIIEKDIWPHALLEIEKFIKRYRLDKKMAAGKYSVLVRSSFLASQWEDSIRNVVQFLLHNPIFFFSPRRQVSACVAAHLEEIIPPSLCERHRV